MITDQDVRQLCRFYTTRPVTAELMGISHNTVYQVQDEKPFILRVTAASHRRRRELLNEMDFLLFISEQGMDVGRPIPSLANEMVTDCEIGGAEHHLTAFQFVDGLHWMRRHDGPDSLRQIGRALGRLHSCAKRYVPAKGVTPRRGYLENQHLKKAPAILAAYGPQLYPCFTALLRELAALPQSHESFGLTHGDFLFSNYHITGEGRVWVFDFDECEYNRYVSDIAVCLYYYLLGGKPSELHGKTEEAERSLLSLMTGYLLENYLPSEELRRIDLFFRLRDFILLSTILGRGEKELSGWDRELVDGALLRVTLGKPFVDIDLDRMVRRLYWE